jgi:hypothetical protein
VNSDNGEGGKSTESRELLPDRPLEEFEIAELARLARRVKVKPVWIAVPLTLWFWPVFLVSVATRRFPPDPFGIFSLILLGAMTIFWEWQVLSGAKLARLLRLDIEAGIVEVQPEDGREKLPASRMDWIVDGQPAPWRGHPPPDVLS